MRGIGSKDLLRPGVRALVVGLLLCCAARPAAARVLRYEAQVDETRVSLGERIMYTIEMVTDDRMPRTLPTQPDLGGLARVGAASPSHQTTIVNGRVSYKLTVRYYLNASETGRYTIGPAVIEIDGRTLATRPISIEVVTPNLEALPPSLRNESIVHPNSNDPTITRQIRGKYFVRPKITKTDPYVGEPVVLTYELYFDSQSPAPERISFAEMPSFEGVLNDVNFQGEGTINTRNEKIDSTTFRVGLLYRAALTPTRPGRFTLEGYEMRFSLPVRDRFSIFGSSSTRVAARGGAIKLNVRPLPETGRPADFTGTVGSFSMASALDQTSATEDDLITLSIELSGSGNVEIASAPELDLTEDFELFDQIIETEKTLAGNRPGGKKVIEYLLRPTRTGTLDIPAINYSIFDPASEAYRRLTSAPSTVEIRKGASSSVVTVAGERQVPEAGQSDSRLHYVKQIVAPHDPPAGPLLENPLYWGAQLLALALAGGVFASSRRRDAADPAEIRRARARGALAKKLKQIHGLASSNEIEPAALALERALREFIADGHDLAADGLTAERIAALLDETGVAPERVVRLGEILDSCASIRYAPGAADPGQIEHMAAEAKSILGVAR